MSHPRIEEVSDSDFDSDPAEGDIEDFADSDIMRRVEPKSSTASSSSALQQEIPAAARQPSPVVPGGAPAAGTLPPAADRSAYADFQCLYPVYFDASRSRAEGRRVSADMAVKDPLAREIANACSRLRLPTLFEPEKVHPKDWANPGRVKVGLKKTPGHPINNKHHLYRLVAEHLRENPTTEDSQGLRVRMGGQLQPEPGKPYPRPAVPRGWKMGELVPYLSAAMTGGGVSENLFKDMMREMQGGGDPMSALM
ncbi:hypothetical protein FZEAL_8105, partial [Fusarium zealandicum]